MVGRVAVGNRESEQSKSREQVEVVTGYTLARETVMAVQECQGRQAIHLNRIILPPICLKIKTGNHSTCRQHLEREQSLSITCGTHPAVLIAARVMAVLPKTTSKVHLKENHRLTLFLGSQPKTHQITSLPIAIAPQELNTRIKWVAASPLNLQKNAAWTNNKTRMDQELPLTPLPTRAINHPTSHPN